MYQNLERETDTGVKLLKNTNSQRIGGYILIC